MNRRTLKKIKLLRRGTWRRADQWKIDAAFRRVCRSAESLRLSIERHTGKPVELRPFLDSPKINADKASRIIALAKMGQS